MTYESIISYIFLREGIGLTEVKNKSRKVPLITARAFCYLLGKKFTHLTFEKLGEPFNKDYSTVLCACKKLNTLMEYELHLKLRYKEYFDYFSEVKNDEIFKRKLKKREHISRRFISKKTFKSVIKDRAIKNHSKLRSRLDW